MVKAFTMPERAYREIYLKVKPRNSGDLQDCLFDHYWPKNIETYCLVFMDKAESTIGGVVHAETSIKPGTIPVGAFLDILFPVAPSENQTDGVDPGDRIFWANLVKAHQANMLRSLAQDVLGKSWEKVTKRDAQARR